MPPEPGRRGRTWLTIAGILHIVGLLLVATVLVHVNSITLMLSIGVGGALLAVSWIMYATVVAKDLRNRRIL